MRDPISDDPEFAALRALSADLGRNPLRTQAAGGNTSLKREGMLWIKASGAWLAEAEERDIMIPVRLDALLAALAKGETAAESAVSFVEEARNPGGLRPSIETSVHAIVPQPVVVHIHCVETIALAVRRDGEARVAERLDKLEDVVWTYVPYCKPGLRLSQSISAQAPRGANVLILANHGLVVSGESVAEVADRLDRVCKVLASPVRTAPVVDQSRLQSALGGSEYRPPIDEAAHAIALDETNLSLARGGSLYPDHVIFLGPGLAVASDIASGAAARPAGGRDGPPPMVAIPGVGVALHRSTTRAADALARCLAEVVSRISAGAEVLRLTPQQERELTNWDAEKYRQALDAKNAARTP
jgi:rhamnose utilization protein RhaD (predicted bifunctional aldolase and dehydrogenase)